MRLLYSLAMLSFLGTGVCAESPVPKGGAPRIGLASAVQKDGKVMIEVHRHSSFAPSAFFSASNQD
jgi:hypothetical protein